MAYRELVEKIGVGGGKYGWPAGASTRYKRLDAYERLLNGTIYEHLSSAFDVEKSSGNRYVPILERRPSIKYGLAKIVVDQHAAMTFGEAHFPHVRCVSPLQDDQTEAQKVTEAACAALIRSMNLPAIMQSAVRKGSVGSAAIVAKIRDDGTPAADVVAGKNAKPKIGIDADFSKLSGLDRIWNITGEDLVDFGYKVEKENLDKTYWLRVYIDKTEWTWFLPMLDSKYRNIGEKDDQNNVIEWQEDVERSGEHGFGGESAPVVWMRNLVCGEDSLDGVCSFESILDICIACDYLLSQGARGLRYSMDPLLVLKTGEMGLASLDLARQSTGTGEISKTTGVLPLMGEDSDAKLLEISGKGFEASQEFFKKLRELALESCGAIRSGDETSDGPQSGKAVELHHLLSVFFIERMRVCYGEDGLLPLLRILLSELQSGQIDLKDGTDWSGIDLNTPLSLAWPAFRIPTGSDLLSEMTALQLAAGGSAKQPVVLLDPKLVSRLTAQRFDLDDLASVSSDAAKVREEQEQQDAEAQQQQHEQSIAAIQAKSATKKEEGAS